MSALVALLLAAGLARADDLRTAVTLLPPQLDEHTSPLLGSALQRGLVAELEGSTVSRLAPISEQAAARLEADPGCRDQPGCLVRALPAGARLAVDARLSGSADHASLVLRLHDRQGEVQSVATLVPRTGLEQEAARELRALLRAHRPDASLYWRASRGEEEASRQLASSYPSSPYLLVLQEDARGHAPTAVRSQDIVVPVAEPEPPPSAPSPAAEPEPEPEPEEAASPPPEPEGWRIQPPVFQLDQIPAGLRQRSYDQRYRALEALEPEPAATSLIWWVLANDEHEEVRHKAWRIIRARWRRGTGDPLEHQAVAVWVFMKRTHERVQAAEVIAERGHPSLGEWDMLQLLGAGIRRTRASQRPALARSTLALGRRLGREVEARAMVLEAIQEEENASVARRMRRLLQ